LRYRVKKKEIAGGATSYFLTGEKSHIGSLLIGYSLADFSKPTGNPEKC
jgi:hypothetical protein